MQRTCALQPCRDACFLQAIHGWKVIVVMRILSPKATYGERSVDEVDGFSPSEMIGIDLPAVVSDGHDKLIPIGSAVPRELRLRLVNVCQSSALRGDY